MAHVQQPRLTRTRHPTHTQPTTRVATGTPQHRAATAPKRRTATKRQHLLRPHNHGKTMR